MYRNETPKPTSAHAKNSPGLVLSHSTRNGEVESGHLRVPFGCNRGFYNESPEPPCTLEHVNCQRTLRHCRFPAPVGSWEAAKNSRDVFKRRKKKEQAASCYKHPDENHNSVWDRSSPGAGDRVAGEPEGSSQAAVGITAWATLSTKARGAEPACARGTAHSASRF